jgi:transcriptional regulator with XRE-family HTH domain
MEKSFRRLKAKKVREAYVEAEIAHGVAAQIRVLRQGRNWSQFELAQKLGTTQNAVSRLEDPSYGKFTIKTLIQLAHVFDVALMTRFMPFSQFMSVTWNTKSEALAANPYEEEESIVRFEYPPLFKAVNISIPSSLIFTDGSMEIESPNTIFFNTKTIA